MTHDEIQALSGRELELAVMEAGGWQREESPVRGWRRGNSFRVGRLKPLTDHNDAAKLRREMAEDHTIRLQVAHTGRCSLTFAGYSAPDIRGAGDTEGAATARAYLMWKELR